MMAASIQSQLSTCSPARSQEGFWDHTELAAGSIYLFANEGSCCSSLEKKKKGGWKILINEWYSNPTHVTLCDSPSLIPSESPGLTPALAAGTRLSLK